MLIDRAIWRMITSATQMPGHDLYDTLEKGIDKAFSEMVSNIKVDIKEIE